ncbi:hypothetical protein [Acuticoccus sp. I52.16.1]|uniref:hypothetical protein n=1 Tax=Acuticoccus sp. I52.16.1 TaxID=2928472 RepID=UPI001FD2A9B2|nr:hypothetical protein [Acuticoccus sp. I52.16.1]UOM33658.1 hypothetical protein MRB58_17700 [Acuticoccus sp. I52.16.1]
MLKLGMVIAGCALGLCACQSSSSTNAPSTSTTVRETVVTAPADLQLLCASEAQTRLGASGDVLPISSAQTTAGRYSVVLSVGNGQATCVVTDQGVIESIA